jgi:hypothetical protein
MVTVHQVALGDRDASVTLSAPPTHMGARNFGDVAISTGGVGEPAELVATGAYFDRHNISRVDVVKIDVQGHETEVLTSLLSALREPPSVIVFESMQRGVALRDRDDVRLLLNHGYVIGALQGSMFRLKIIDADPTQVPAHRHIDFVALHPDTTWAGQREAIGWQRA